MGDDARLRLDHQIAVRFDDLKVVDPVGIKIPEMGQPRRRQHLEQKGFDGLFRDRHGLEAHVVEAVAHGRGVGITGAMQDVVFHELIQRFHVHGNLYVVLAAARENSRNRADVAKSRP